MSEISATIGYDIEDGYADGSNRALLVNELVSQAMSRPVDPRMGRSPAEKRGMNSRAPSTPIGAERIGRSAPAARNAVSCSRHRESGPIRQVASRMPPACASALEMAA